MKFLESHYLYFYLLLFTIIYPIAQSFEKRIKLYKKFKFIAFGILTVLIIFIPWDIYFTQQEVWWFNENYTTGIQIFNLPIEEVLFFVIVPFACVFIYEVLNYFIKQDILKNITRPLFVSLSLVLIAISFIYINHLYTFVCFLVTGITLFIVSLLNPKWLSRFLLAYFISLFPFLLINGILTGSLIENPVVNYNPIDIIGLRIITIPIEDFIYNLLMFLVLIGVYEQTKSFYQPKS
jgi:lycopene cyclase domain-containing protein